MFPGATGFKTITKLDEVGEMFFVYIAITLFTGPISRKHQGGLDVPLELSGTEFKERTQERKVSEHTDSRRSY